ncbi:MAG: crosslink repair DNA glycosylase YcaQ family protein, partial [Candidatus Hermodarchaeota archaeon]|nr:crosslink repair DNA glycosylase YcaQ family protein [Candidatus Hermodarchaeota archaeon]
LIIAATGPRLYRMARKSKSLHKLSNQQVETLLNQFLAALEDKPLRMRELKQALPTLTPMMRPLLYLGMATGQVVRASTPHARSTLSSYALMKQRFPEITLQQYTEEEASTQLIHRYIALFGPVSVSDIAWWLPTTKTQATTALTTLANELVELETSEGLKYMTQSDFETAQTLSLPTDPVIAFLPYEDYLAKAFIDRSWFIEPDLQDRLFPRKARSYWPTGTTPTRAPALTSGINQSGEIRPSIWLNGSIVGRWELGGVTDNITISYDLYSQLPSAIRTQIQEQQKRLEAFVNTKLLPISRARK